tara:strand:+ start:688 stop:1005 length:318 start_codon:yes stop_codon:yes gene_type:complete
MSNGQTLLEYYLSCNPRFTIPLTAADVNEEELNDLIDFICKDQELNREEDQSIIMLMTFNLMGYAMFGEEVRKILGCDEHHKVQHALIATHILKLAINHLKTGRV